MKHTDCFSTLASNIAGLTKGYVSHISSILFKGDNFENYKNCKISNFIPFPFFLFFFI